MVDKRARILRNSRLKDKLNVDVIVSANHCAVQCWASERSMGAEAALSVGPRVRGKARRSARDRHLFDQIGRAVNVLHNPQHVAAVDVNRTGQTPVEIPIGNNALKHAIEQQSYQLGIAV